RGARRRHPARGLRLPPGRRRRRHLRAGHQCARSRVHRARPDRRKAHQQMIGRLNHGAIVVADLAAAAATYRDLLGAETGAPQVLPAHGVTIVFVDLPNTRIELMTPLGPASPVAKFLAAHPGGALHHVCYEVADLTTAARTLTAA